MKRGIYCAVFVLLAGSLSACSSKATTAEGCASTTAVGHSPKSVTPPATVLAEKVSKLTLVTNCGNIEISLLQDKAPLTVTAITTLARAGFYDATLCHRLTTLGIYVLQCGDPTATGSGGPTFHFPDENLPPAINNNYPAGTVAMANSGPNTNGSQFFLVYDDTSLGAAYTIWGTITSGLDIVKKIAAAGVDGGSNDGKPKMTIAIESVSVK